MGSKSKVLFISLSVFPFSVVIVTPASASAVSIRLVRELSSSTLYHVMEGLGLATAMQINMAEAGWVTVNAVSSLMVGVAGGTAKKGCINNNII